MKSEYMKRKKNAPDEIFSFVAHHIKRSIGICDVIQMDNGSNVMRGYMNNGQNVCVI